MRYSLLHWRRFIEQFINRIYLEFRVFAFIHRSYYDEDNCVFSSVALYKS